MCIQSPFGFDFSFVFNKKSLANESVTAKTCFIMEGMTCYSQQQPGTDPQMKGMQGKQKVRLIKCQQRAS